jgi:Cu-Zn family superoxide dismutase
MAIGLRTAVAGCAGGVWLAVAATASLTSAQLPPAAAADVRDRLSRFIGTATFVEEPGGVHITGVLRNLPPGPHGLHIDNVAKCLSPSFVSAGTIFNPTGKKHGLRNPAGPQVGDLPSLVVSGDGVAVLDFVAAGATLSGGPSSLVGGNGTALVIHTSDDDQVTDPEGDAGERFACGVILPGDPVAASATAQARGPGATTTATTPVQPVAAQAPPVTVAQPAGAAAVVTQQPVTSSENRSILSSPLLPAVLGIILVGAGYLLRRPH